MNAQELLKEGNEALEDAHAKRKSGSDLVIVLDGRFRALLIAQIKKISKSRFNPEKLADVYQESLMQILIAVRKPEFDSKEPLKLIFTITKRICLQHLKKLEKSPNIGRLNESTLHASSLGKQWNNLDEIEREDFQQRILGDIDSLGDKDRSALITYLQNYDALGRRAGYLQKLRAILIDEGMDESISVKTVKSRLERARKKIGVTLQKMLEGETSHE